MALAGLGGCSVREFLGGWRGLARLWPFASGGMGGFGRGVVVGFG